MHASHQHEVVYPSSDGERMADNTLQYEWIVTIKGGLDQRLPDFVAGDLLWYPLEGHPEVRAAPDVMVALGRPKGHRSSYRQWEEAGVGPAVVFEILSPGNTLPEMAKKRAFYQKWGVEEYYVYDPDRDRLEGWLRRGGALEEIRPMDGWVSPLLGVRFVCEPEGLALYGPEGRRFESFQELADRAEANEAVAVEARREREKARQERDAAEARAERLAARLRALGVEPD